jgi:hypothetical protein
MIEIVVNPMKKSKNAGPIFDKSKFKRKIGSTKFVNPAPNKESIIPRRRYCILSLSTPSAFL